MSPFTFSLGSAPPPPAAVAIGAGRVAGLVLDDRGGRAVVTAHASAALPEEAVVPGLNALNIRDAAAVSSALARVLAAIGHPRRVGLIVGDPVAKVSQVRLQQVPSRAQDLDQVIRWQVRKSAPFSIDDAQVSYQPTVRTSEGQEFLVTLARRDVVAEYEALCAGAGAHAGLVDLSTLNVVNAVLAGDRAPSGDWLLVNVAPGWESIAIMRGADLIFFRSRGADGEGTLADLVHQTAMYYEDRLSGAGFSRVLMCGASASGDTSLLRQTLSERLSAGVESIGPTVAAGLVEGMGDGPGAVDALTPLVGMLLRQREAA